MLILCTKDWKALTLPHLFGKKKQWLFISECWAELVPLCCLQPSWCPHPFLSPFPLLFPSRLGLSEAPQAGLIKSLNRGSWRGEAETLQGLRTYPAGVLSFCHIPLLLPVYFNFEPKATEKGQELVKQAENSPNHTVPSSVTLRSQALEWSCFLFSECQSLELISASCHVTKA